MVVVDASAVTELLFNGPVAARLRERLSDESELHAPHLIDLEVMQVLRRALRRGALTEAGAADALDDFERLHLTRYPHTPFRARIWDLRANVTAYDAAYLALAEVLNAPLITTDGRLSRAPGIRVAVEVWNGGSS